MSTKKNICEHCGGEFDEFELYETPDGEVFCAECMDSLGYHWCEYAEAYYPSEDFEVVHTGYWETISISRAYLEDCSDDYYFCEHCNEWYEDDYRGRVETENDGTICYRCYEDDYVTCENCGAVVRYDDAYDDEGDYLCQRCASRYSTIHNYSYKPDPKCKNKKDDVVVEYNFPEDCDELLFGAELEIDWGENRADCANEICKIAPDVYVKRDGSLGDNGMEIVTHPCTLEYHTAELGWDKICSTAHRYEYRSHDTRSCGLHIHVGKHQLGKDDAERKETVAKIVLLVDRFWDEMKRFSRRREGQLRQWARPPMLSIEPGSHTKKNALESALYIRNCSRYQAVNLGNSKTIEFRLFNGSLKPVTIIATLQLVSNICSYAKEYDVKDVMASQWDDIVNYQKYPELEAYLKSRGMTEFEPKSPVWFKIEPETFDSEIKVGDRVVVTNLKHGLHPSFLGQTARVVYIESNWWDNVKTYTVEFDRRFNDNLWRVEHDQEQLTNENGYKVFGENIRKTI